MTLPEAPSDVQATIARLFVHPVKSCAGVELRESLLTETGLEFDRAWMVVDAAGEAVTQRERPRMALVRPQLRQSDMVLRAPGMLALHVAFERVEGPVRVRLWGDEVAAYDMGAVAAQWFSDFLAEPGLPAKLRLVRFDPGHRRLSDPLWTDGAQAMNQFSDGFAVLVASEASLAGLNDRLAATGHPAVDIERFRPNIVLAGVEAHDEDRLDTLRIATTRGTDDAGDGPEARLRLVKPCARCPIPDIDPATALRGHAVGDALQGYRRDERVGGAVTFGMNAIVLSGVDRLLEVGQQVRGDYVFD